MLAAAMITTVNELLNLLQHNRNVFLGTDILGVNGDSNRFQNEAKEILADNKMDPSIIDQHYVFLIHQGYAFSMVRKDCINGPVFTYCEGNGIVSDFKTIDDLIREYGECG